MRRMEPSGANPADHGLIYDLSSFTPSLSEPPALPTPTASTSDTSANPMPNVPPHKRKARPQKVCQPCRMRKVKCTYEFPCKTCIERGHPELCEYLPDLPSKRIYSTAHLEDGERFIPSKEQWTEMGDRIAGVENVLRELRDGLHRLQAQLGHGKAAPLAATDADQDTSSTHSDRTVLQGMSASNELAGDSIYLGENSVPAMVVALVKNTNMDKTTAVEEVLGKSILPVFGLDNESATYPFVDLWGIPHGSFKRIELLCKLLPTTDSDCIRTFQQYRDTAHVIFPGIVDIAQFESDLLDFLRHRSWEPLAVQPGNLDNQTVYGRDLHWLGLLFAALASGVQCSDLPRKERQLKSQVYVCCAYECLRIVNYLSRSTLSDLQNLLVLGNVISNNMNAGVAWSLLGLTIRLAQSLGLHYEVPASDPSANQTAKSSIWWQIIWQDSLLSITFDRSSQASIAAHLSHRKTTSKLSYINFMRRLCKMGLDIVQRRTVAKPTQAKFLEIMEIRNQIKEDEQHLEPHLTDIANCRSMREQLEFWNLYLHRSYILSELCRPTLNRHKVPYQQEELARSLHTLCVESLTNTVDAFLGLQNITSFATQSWAAVHRSLSCALLLGILGEASRSNRVRNLVGRLTTVMSHVVSSVDRSELSTPLARSMAALVKLSAEPPPAENEPSQMTLAFEDWNEADDLMSGVARAGNMDSPLPHSSKSSSSSETSPYSVLNSIMWGPLDMLPLG